MEVGKIVRVAGPVIDVEFPAGNLPAIYNALSVEPSEAEDRAPLIVEVILQTGNNRVRAIAMGPTEGLTRGMDVVDTGGPIKIGVGLGTLGRAVNVLGRPIDGNGPVEAAEEWPIHRAAPTLMNIEPVEQVFETGIKVIDL
ncbi:MAG: F0F1 ATP synthase subunit beta, partial [bacterium]|nr:F0F1 ATP synthase subunit beta [bacterium]